MESPQLHQAQITILDFLRHHEQTRFSTLMRAAGMTSDTFKFHVRKLLLAGLVRKTADDAYTLTAAGKEYANNLDTDKRAVQKQPKLSVLLIVPHPTEPGLYLFQERKRNPYYGFWSCIGGPVRWGELAGEAAQRELTKQTSLTAAFDERLCLRKRDYDASDGQLLEDKIFLVLEASQVAGKLSNDWPGGMNEWLTIDAFQAKEKTLGSAASVISAVHDGKTFVSEDAQYDASDY